MGNKEDWKEIEEWASIQKQKDIKRYKMDINNIDMKRNEKKIRKVSKGMSFIGKVLKLCTFFIFILTFYLVGSFTIRRLSMGNVNINKALLNGYGIRINVVSKETDKYGNGTYVLSVKGKKDITFKAIKEYGGLKEDFPSNSLKYYFTNWADTDKELFTIDEKTENGFLTYQAYLEIERYEDIENAVKVLRKFASFCKKDFQGPWDVYLKKGYARVYHHDKSEEDEIKEAKTIYLKYIQENNIEEDIPAEEFNKYVK